MPVQTTNQIVGERRWIALAAVMVTLFFSALDQTIVSTAMPTIIGDLNGFSLYAWVFTAYMLTSAILVPIFGKLSDIYGRRPFYLFGLLVFMIGSALAGLSKSMGWLIAARALQGVGGGAMLSMPRATIGDIFNPKERGKWMGLIMSVFGLASIIGPYFGGWITDHWSWRWIFYINLPVAMVALVAVWYALPTVRTEKRHRIDWSGSVVLVCALVPILLGFTWAGTKYAWDSVQTVLLFAVGAAFTAIFVFAERRASEPLLNPSLFSQPIFVTTVLIGLFVAMTMFGSLLFLPVFVQGVIGLSAQNTGAVLTPMMLSFVIGSAIGGYLITRTGKYKLQAVLGTLFLIAGVVLLSQMSIHTRWVQVIIYMIILGAGIGSIMPLINVVIQNAFPYSMLGMVNSTQQFVNSLGGIIATPILGTVLANTFQSDFAKRLSPQLSGALANLPKSFSSALNNPQQLIESQAQVALKAKFAALGNAGEALYHQFMTAVRGALSTGVTRIFTVAIVFAVLTFVTTLFLKEIRLKRDEFYNEDQPESGLTDATKEKREPGRRGLKSPEDVTVS